MIVVTGVPCLRHKHEGLPLRASRYSPTQPSFLFVYLYFTRPRSWGVNIWAALRPPIPWIYSCQRRYKFLGFGERVETPHGGGWIALLCPFPSPATFGLAASTLWAGCDAMRRAFELRFWYCRVWSIQSCCIAFLISSFNCLASDEYSAAVDVENLPESSQFVKVVFWEEGRVIAVHAKCARGPLRYILRRCLSFFWRTWERLYATLTSSRGGNSNSYKYLLYSISFNPRSW